MKSLSNMFHFLGTLLRKNIPTVEEAQRRGLKHDSNVYGDAINHQNCRSWWTDKYGNFYRCDQLFIEDKNDGQK